jgi:hypothetical protein
MRGTRDPAPQAYLQLRNPGFIFLRNGTQRAVRDVGAMAVRRDKHEQSRTRPRYGP